MNSSSFYRQSLTFVKSVDSRAKLKDAYAEYCPNCHANITNRTNQDKDDLIKCPECSKENKQLIIIDPEVKWHLENETYYHESVGILLVNSKGELLCFKLNKFPYGFTIPAGHIDKGENPPKAVAREAHEEVNARLTSPKLLVQATIHGDKCRRGCDDHLWWLYGAKISPEDEEGLQVDEKEGTQLEWVSYKKFRDMQVPFAMNYFIKHHSKEIADYIENI